MIGTKLAHYEITTHLGSGGMGDVYQVTDSKLGRSVAIKFLAGAFSHDTERVARFQREARVLASLNHPCIAAIYGVEEIQGRHFLVMELAPGETKRWPIASNVVRFRSKKRYLSRSRLRRHWRKLTKKESSIEI
jgi:serine/threonine protein kinase